MFPPGRGNDNLDAGSIYLISLYGTNEVLTAVRIDICVKGYQEGHRGQMWICEIDSDYQISMRNRETGNLLRWNDDQCRVKCMPPHDRAWERLTFVWLGLGGYSIRVNPGGGNQLRPLQRPSSDSQHLKAGEAGTQFGLHKLKNPVFRRFEWVIPGRLARSSAPYYDSEDFDQSINETSIEFLDNHGINNIISLNSEELPPREKSRLRAAGISYSHIKAVEYTAVTQEQFDQIWNAYDKAGVTIVYCGYGDGRTGMAISAIQLFQGRALNDKDYRGNGVQCPSQLAALNELNERLHDAENSSGPHNPPTTQPPPGTVTEKKN